jgi:hypothetical protein
MKLIDDAAWVARRAWSVRFAALAAFSAVSDAVLPLLVDDLPHNAFAALTAFSAIMGVLARFVHQDHDDR